MSSVTSPVTLIKPESPAIRSCQSMFFPWSLAINEPLAKVEFLGLRRVYEKAQSRVNKKSRQRVEKGRVRIMVTSDAQIQHIEVHVERIPKAASLFGDKCGEVRLKTNSEDQHVNKVCAWIMITQECRISLGGRGDSQAFFLKFRFAKECHHTQPNHWEKTPCPKVHHSRASVMQSSIV